MATHSSTLAWKIPGKDRGAWWAAVHGVAKNRTRLSDFPFTFPFHELKKEMATHSSVLAWRVPGTGKLGGLLSMGSHRVGHNWSNLGAAYTYFDQFKFSVFWDYENNFKVYLYGWWCIQVDIRSDQISRSVVSDSLRPHELQHARPLSITNSRSSTRLTSIESVMSSSHLINAKK